MFDMSWSELLLIAVVALIVIGPKDLPKALKTVAQFAHKARSLAREFQSGVEEMAREAELHEIKADIEKAAATDFVEDLQNSIDPGGEVAKSLEIQAEDAAKATSIEPAHDVLAAAVEESRDPVFVEPAPSAPEVGSTAAASEAAPSEKPVGAMPDVAPAAPAIQKS